MFFMRTPLHVEETVDYEVAFAHFGPHDERARRPSDAREARPGAAT
jgi:hypothetical protein